LNVRSPSGSFTRPFLLLAILAAGQPAAAQTVPPSDGSLPSVVSNPRVVIHVYAEPSFNRMGDWHARIDALKAEAATRLVPISNEVTNGYISWGGTLLVRFRPRILVGGELGKVQDQDRFAVTEPLGGIFPGSAEFGVGVRTVGRNAQFVLAFYPREQSRTHFQVGAGIGQSHVSFDSRRAGAEGDGTGPILSALFGTEWKYFYFTAGARVNRIPITYSQPYDLGGLSGPEFLKDPDVDLSGVFVRVGLAFHWFPE
jgi:hypothetical protein